MNKKLRWGILSTANIAQKQVIPAIERTSDNVVAAIASESGKAQEAAQKFHIAKAYESYEQLLQDTEIDAVYIPLPNNLHKHWVMEAAKRGKHVLCEKPAALDAKEAREMIDVCAQNDVFFMEAFMYQFHPQHQRVKELIENGAIGEVKLMRAGFSFLMDENKRSHDIRTQRELGGGSLYDVGCYCLHTFRNILGAEPVQALVAADTDNAFQVDMGVRGILEMDNGIPALFDCSFDMAFREQYEIIGTKGSVTVPRAYRPDQFEGEGIIQITADGSMKEEKVYGDQYRAEIEHFYRCVLEGEAPLYSGEQTVKNMEAIDLCYSLINK